MIFQGEAPFPKTGAEGEVRLAGRRLLLPWCLEQLPGNVVSSSGLHASVLPSHSQKGACSGGWRAPSESVCSSTPQEPSEGRGGSSEHQNQLTTAPKPSGPAPRVCLGYNPHHPRLAGASQQLQGIHSSPSPSCSVVLPSSVFFS